MAGQLGSSLVRPTCYPGRASCTAEITSRDGNTRTQCQSRDSARNTCYIHLSCDYGYPDTSYMFTQATSRQNVQTLILSMDSRYFWRLSRQVICEGVSRPRTRLDKAKTKACCLKSTTARIGKCRVFCSTPLSRHSMPNNRKRISPRTEDERSSEDESDMSSDDEVSEIEPDMGDATVEPQLLIHKGGKWSEEEKQILRKHRDEWRDIKSQQDKRAFANQLAQTLQSLRGPSGTDSSLVTDI